MPEHDAQPGDPPGRQPPPTAPADPAVLRPNPVIDLARPGAHVDGTPPADGPGPRPRFRARRVVLGSLLVAAMAAATVSGVAGWRILAQKDATLTVPEQVAGLQLDHGADAATAAEYLRTALTAEVGLDAAVGAVYTDPADMKRSVLLFGGTALIWTPAKDLDTAFDLVNDNTGAVTGLHEVPGGRLGGTMKCGTTDDATGTMAVCGWADHGSLALAMFPNRSAAEAAPLMRSIRGAALRRH